MLNSLDALRASAVGKECRGRTMLQGGHQQSIGRERGNTAETPGGPSGVMRVFRDFSN